MPSSFSWSTPNTKEAACFASLGFTFSCDITEDCVHDNPTGDVLAQWIIHDNNTQVPSARLEHMLTAWQRKSLDPMHPLMCRWRACHNFEMLREWQDTGRRLRLVPVANDQAFEYRDGEELPTLTNPETGFQLGDFDLTAALALIGIPAIDAVGEPRKRLYTLPQYGHPRLINGEWRTEDASQLVRRVPDGYDLILETSQPDHPLVHAYNALHTWGQLRKHYKQERRKLLLRFPKFTQRRAVISEAASPRVIDRMRQHLRLPGR